MTDVAQGSDSKRAADGGVDDLVVEALAALESRGPAGIEEIVRRNPGHADVLLARLAKLRGIGLLGSPETTAEPIPERLGEFSLRARIGGGGMGVVYLAEQSRLARLVALKVVRPDLLFFEGARTRFEREAQAVARLAHPSIVPVYSVGEDGGVPWFAMEYVRGATLAEVIADLRQRDPATLRAEDLWDSVERLTRRRSESLGDTRTPGALDRSPLTGAWSRAAAEIVRSVAEAVQHAHELGVLHRDIKPSNVLLTPAGRAMLFDFGLSTSSESARLTMSGVRVGSLAYMSPEQLDGHADERSDVYGLAVTLYELVALDLPFLPSGGEALASAVRHGDIVAPRRRNPAIPADLETVILAGLERDPARRYATAAEFAAELTRVLELRPILATRPGPMRKAVRLAQRHPGATLAAFVALAALIALPTAWIVQERRASRAVGEALARADANLVLAQANLRLADENLERADANLVRADVNLERALEAVERMLVQVGDSRLAEVPAAAKAREALLADATEFYERFLAENQDDPRTVRLAVRASTKLAWLFVQLGSPQKALTAGARAEELAEAWITRDPGVESLVAWARATDPVHHAYANLGDFDEGARHMDRVIERLEPAVAAHPGDIELTVALCTVLDRRALVSVMAREYDEAEAIFVRAATLIDELVAAHPSHGPLLDRQAMAQNNLGSFYLNVGETSEAIAPLQRARGLLVESLPRREDALTVEGDLAAVESNLAVALGAEGDANGELELLAAANARLARLIEILPDRAAWPRSLGIGLAREAQALERAGRAAEGTPLHARAAELARRSFARTTGHPKARAELGGVLANQAHNLRLTGRFAEAAALAVEALALVDDDEVRPNVPLLVRTLFQHLERSRLALGDHAGVLEAATAHAESLGDDGVDLRIAGGIVVASLDALAADPALSDDERARLGEERLAIALRWLRGAAEKGQLTRVALEKAPDYAPLRAREDFERIAAELLGER